MVTGTATEVKEADGKTQPKGSSDTRPADNKGRTDNPPKMYTEAEVAERIKSVEGKIGGQIRIERDTLRTQLTETARERDSLKSQIAETKESIESLSREKDAWGSDEPEKSRKLAELRKDLETLKTSLKDKDTNWSEKIKFAEKRERDDLVYEVADEFGADHNAFMEAADDLEIKNDRKKLEALARHQGLKPKEESAEKETPVKQPPKPFSVVTTGGSDNLANMSPKERANEADRRLRTK